MERKQLYRVIIGLVFLALALILFLGVLSYDPADPPRPMGNFPGNPTTENWCGIVGAYLAYGTRVVFGTGAYLIAIILGVVGALFVTGESFESPILRGVGALVLLVSWCASADLVLPKSVNIGGYGGLLGKLLHEGMLAPLGTFGSYLIAFLGVAIGALLAAHELVIWSGRRMLRLLGKLARRRKLKPKQPLPAKQAAPPPALTPPPDPLAEQKERLRKRLEEQRAATQEKRKPEPELPTEVDASRPTRHADLPTVPVKKWPLALPRRRGPAQEETAGDYQLPKVDLLDPTVHEDAGKREEHIESKRAVLERTLEEFGIAAQVVEIDRGPVITQFELELAPGVKINRIIGLADDMARALKAQSVRVVAPIPGKSTVGVEVPNLHRRIVRLREVFESGVLERKRMTLPLLLGRDAGGEPLVADLSQMPHLLIAGATGSGKSVCINSMIMTLLMTQYPDEVKLLLIDPKMVELSVFHDIPHLMSRVLTDMKKAVSVLEWATKKMDERYSLLANVGARNIAAYNTLGEEGIRKRLDVGPSEDLDGVPFRMPYIIIICDELADLMMIGAKDVENAITRLAQKSRAVGIHLIMATQRPSVDVVTGLIKANLPSRVAFQTASKVDSRTILDRNGAEKLLGRGDMLFLPPGSAKLIRAQGSFTSDAEIRKVVNFLAEQSRPRFDAELMQPKGVGGIPPEERDELFPEAVQIILESQRGSVSLLQRRLGIGYSRAARLIDLMAEVGIVGDYKGSQAREVLYTLEEWEARQGEEDSEQES